MLSLFEFGKRFALPLWPYYLGGTIFLAATNLITLQIPKLAKQVIDGMETMASGASGQDLSNIALIIILLGSLQVIVRSLSRILIFWPGRRIEEISKSFLFKRALALPLAFFNRFGMGDLISRLSNDLSQVRVFFAFAVLQVLNLIFISVFTITEMIRVHPMLTLFCLIPIVIMLALTRFIMPALARFNRENQEAIGRLTNRVTEAFTNIHVLKLNTAEESFQKKIEKENEEVYTTNMKVVVLRTLFFPLLTSLTAFSQLAVLGYGGFQVIQGEITVGDILAFNIYLSYLAFPLTSIGIILSIYQRSKTAMGRISPIFEEEPEKTIQELNDASKQSDSKPLLSVSNLSYRFPDAVEDVLKDISFDLARGEKIGICGAVGSGKSTLFRLLCRLIDPPKGTIRLDGQDILSIEPGTLREKIGFSMQEVHLFSDSVVNNLAFGMNEKPSEQDMIEASKGAQIHDEIEGFSRGWDTEIGEKGVRLSGGQKQRLALARLFLRQQDILLLDDVLSAVDNQTEAALVDYIESRSSASIIASHRSSVLHICDKVILLKNGEIQAIGPFATLLKSFPELGDIHEQSEKSE